MERFWGTFAVVAVVLASLAGSFFGGVYVGFNSRPAIQDIQGLTNKETGKPVDIDFSPFWQAWSIVDEKYVNGNSTSTEEIKNEERVWGAISGMVNSLGDPYTIFLPPEEKRQFEEDISGNFSGLGMEVGVKDGVLTVVAPLPNSPAKKAGIKAGDKILEINSKPTGEMTVDEAIGQIRGPEGSKVVLTLVSMPQDKNETIGEPRQVTVTRAIINIPTIDTEKRNDGIFVIRLYNFSANSPQLFRDALKEFAAARTDKLILDLRGNPGGYLEAAVDMASFFLPKGKVIVWEHQGDTKEDTAYRSKGYDVFSDKLKMVVLIDRGSASASEILAGALSEYDVATLVGETTFGKGSVQELVPVTYNTSLKITIARWLTPKGISISKAGLKPAIAVPLSAEDYTTGRDPQMNKAVEILLKK